MRIDSVSYGEIVLGGKTYYSDMLVWWDSKVEMVEKTHLLDFSLLMKLLERKPDAIVAGVGLVGTVKLLPEFKQKARERKVKLFVESTGDAVDVFNGLLADGKKAVAVMHVTL